MPENKTVLLMGPPNVGKSVIFNRLTGMNVSVANYVGTTVEYSAGKFSLNGDTYTLIDAPGTYSLEANCEAEEVAIKMLRGETTSSPAGSGHCGTGSQEHTHTPGKPAAVICVLDAGNLENSLYLLFQVLQEGLPVVVALNRSDLARKKGYRIDANTLSRELNSPVVSTVAVTGDGIDKLKQVVLKTLQEGKPASREATPEPASWEKVETLLHKIEHKQESSESTSQKNNWELMLTRPWPGLPLALVIVGLVLLLVIGLGMGLRQFILLPFFRGAIFPLVESVVTSTVPPGIIQNILIGDYGFLIKGIEWPFALVLPYVISFYTALSLLEDSGYMPRLAVLLDGLLNRLGIQGTGVIPLLLGYGCAIPAILSTRAMGTRKERTIITAMVCLAVPCISQTGALISLLAEQSVGVMLAVFMLGFLVLIGTGLLLDRLLHGNPAETLMEIPELLLPRADVTMKKVWSRIKHYMGDGALPMIGVVGLAAFLYETGIMAALGELMRPLVVNWLGLPPGAAVPLVLGILRRELAVLPLLELELSSLQLFVGGTVALFYVPCIAVIAVLMREFRFTFAASILLVTTGGAFIAGGILYRLGTLLLS